MKIAAIVLMLILIVGCSDVEVSKLREQVKTLESNNTDLKQQVNKLTIQTDKLSKPSMTTDDLSGVEFKDSPYNWIKDNIVDKIEISDQSLKQKITITDSLIIGQLPELLRLKKDNLQYPSGVRSEIEPYIFTLYSHDKNYSFTVVDRGVILLKGGIDQYIEVDAHIHQFGMAFINKPSYDENGTVFAKLTESGMLITEGKSEKRVFISPYYLKVLPISLGAFGKILKQAPINPGEPLSTWTYYYYGSLIHVYMNEKYTHISDGEKHYWYEYKQEKQNAEHPFNAG